MVVDGPRSIRVVIGHAELIGQVVDDQRVGRGRAIREQVLARVREHAAEAVVPRALADAIDRVFCRRAQERAPGLVAGTRARGERDLLFANRSYDQYP